MAEAVAAFYAVETAVEGAAVGAYVASRPTVPLHARFRKLRLPSKSPEGSFAGPLVGHSLDIVKGKGYIFGGDAADGDPNARVRILTLPSALESGEVDLQIVDAEAASERPLEAYSTPSHDAAPSPEKVAGGQSGNSVPKPRAAHASTSIGSNIFVLGGRAPRTHTADGGADDNGDLPLFGCDTVHCFSTQTHTWTTLHAISAKTGQDIPCPRTQASCASSTSPEPGEGIDITTRAHGTIFLHGGYDAQGNMLRDTWSFDVSSKAWSRWPDLPDPSPQEIAGEGKIVCRGATLCRVGDGFGKVMYMDFDVVKGSVVGSTSGPIESEVGIIPSSGTWDIRSFDNTSSDQLANAERLPVPRRGAGFASITTGAGRHYNLYFMGQDGPSSVLNDIWSYQVQPEKNTPAAMKDAVRKVLGKGTGLDEWALCEVVQSTKSEGPLDLPGAMTDFASDVWWDLGGGNVVIWGGRTMDGHATNEGWILSVE